MRLRALIATSALALVTARAFAGQSMKIVYHHTTGILESRTSGDKVIDSVEAGSGDALDLRGGKTVGVWIDDPNPVLFIYQWDKLTFEDNADYAAALSFAKTISPINTVLGGTKAAAGKIEAGPTESNFSGTVTKLKELAKSMPEIAGLTVGTDTDIATAKSRVGNWNLSDLESKIDDFYSELRRGNFGAGGSNVRSDLSTGLTDATYRGADPLGGETAAAKDKAAAENAAQEKAAQEKATIGQATLNNEILRAMLEEADIRKTLATLKTFAGAVRDVNKKIRLGEVPYDMKKNPTAHVTISAVPEFQKIAEDSGRAIGSVAIAMRPYYPAHFAVAPAIVYSFVKASTFTATAQADGKFKIVENESEYRGTNVSAMFSITPRGWDEPTLGGSFQIGISPVKDQIGFFGGAKLHITDLINLGFGYGYQQVPRLSRDLDINVPLTMADQLKTVPHFKGGFYLSFDIKVPSI